MPATLAAGLAVRLLMEFRSPVINTDGPMFISIARGFLSGHFSAATDAGFHPLYPALVALFGGGEGSGLLVSAVAGALAGWPLWLLMRDLAGARAAFLALLVYELHPGFADIQSSVFADGVFMLFAAGAASGAIRYARGGGGLRLASIGAGLAFLTKSEGLIVVVLTIVTLGVGVARRAAGKDLAAAALIMAVIATPYVIHLSVHSGRFRYTPKDVVETAVGRSSAAEGGTGKWSQRREELGPLVTSGWYAAQSTTRAVGWFHLVPLAAAAATWRAWRHRMSGQGWLAAWIGFYLVCVAWTNFKSGHQISVRYVHPPVAWALLSLGAFGAWGLETGTGGIRAWPARLAAIGLLALAVSPILEGRRLDQAVFRDAGEWILRAHGPGAVVASTVDKVPYYAQGTAKEFQTRPPEADYWVFTDKDAEKARWNWRGADLGPFQHAVTLPDPPDPNSRTVHILRRRRP